METLPRCQIFGHRLSSVFSFLPFAVCIWMKSQLGACLGYTCCANVVFARSVLNKLANKHIQRQQSAKTASFCHKWTLKFPNSLNLMWWHIFKQPNRSRIILMYVKLGNKTCRPRSPKAGGLVFLHCTNFGEISAVLPLRPYKWQQLILLLQGGKKVLLYLITLSSVWYSWHALFTPIYQEMVSFFGWYLPLVL